MAYEKNTWVTGDIITEEKLNHMEDGIAGAGGSDYLFEIITNENDQYDFEIIGPDFDDVLDKVLDGTATARWKNILPDGVSCNYAVCTGMEGCPDDDPAEQYVSFYFIDGIFSSIDVKKTNAGYCHVNNNDMHFIYTYADGVYTCTFDNI